MGFSNNACISFCLILINSLNYVKRPFSICLAEIHPYTLFFRWSPRWIDNLGICPTINRWDFLTAAWASFCPILNSSNDHFFVRLAEKHFFLFLVVTSLNWKSVNRYSLSAVNRMNLKTVSRLPPKVGRPTPIDDSDWQVPDKCDQQSVCRRRKGLPFVFK